MKEKEKWGFERSEKLLFDLGKSVVQPTRIVISSAIKAI